MRSVLQAGLRRVAPAWPFAVSTSGSIDRSTILHAVGRREGSVFTLKKVLEQGMIGDDSDFSGKVCVKWKDTDFEPQVRSESLIPRGDAIHAQATARNHSAAEGALLEQREVDKHPRKC